MLSITPTQKETFFAREKDAKEQISINSLNVPPSIVSLSYASCSAVGKGFPGEMKTHHKSQICFGFDSIAFGISSEKHDHRLREPVRKYWLWGLQGLLQIILTFLEFKRIKMVSTFSACKKNVVQAYERDVGSTLINWKTGGRRKRNNEWQK